PGESGHPPVGTGSAPLADTPGVDREAGTGSLTAPATPFEDSGRATLPLDTGCATLLLGRCLALVSHEGLQGVRGEFVRVHRGKGPSLGAEQVNARLLLHLSKRDHQRTSPVAPGLRGKTLGSKRASFRGRGPIPPELQ